MSYKQKIETLVEVLKNQSKEYEELSKDVPRKDDRIEAAEECGVYIGKSEAYEDVAERLKEMLK